MLTVVRDRSGRLVPGLDFAAWLTEMRDEGRLLACDRRGAACVATVAMSSRADLKWAVEPYDLFSTMVRGGCLDGVQHYSLSRRTALARHGDWLGRAEAAQGLTALRAALGCGRAISDADFAAWTEDHLRGTVRLLATLGMEAVLGFSHADDIAMFMLSQWYAPPC